MLGCFRQYREDIGGERLWPVPVQQLINFAENVILLVGFEVRFGWNFLGHYDAGAPS